MERFYPSAPGGGWTVMDSLDMHGGLGGAVAISGGYAYQPLRLDGGTRSLAVVSDQAFAGVALAVTYERFRMYVNFDSPLAVSGDSGTVGTYQLTAPDVSVSSRPDTISDVRLGFDERVLGGPRSAFRLGVGAQLMVPSGIRDDYGTDGTYRGMFRVLFAGDVGRFTYAGQVGIHLRPLDDTPAPGSPAGSELLFGVAAGPRFRFPRSGASVVVGPELYGETAFRSFLGGATTGVEGLLTGRIEGPGDDGPQLRLKLGAGGGIHPEFGAPEWRVVFALEVLGHARR